MVRVSRIAFCVTMACCVAFTNVAQSQFDDSEATINLIREAYEAINLPASPTDEQIAQYLKEVKEVGNKYQVTYTDLATQALMRLGEESIPMLLTTPDLVSDYALADFLGKFDVSKYKQQIIEALPLYPRLIDIVNKYSWGDEAADYVALSLPGTTEKVAKRRLALFLMTRWKPEYRQTLLDTLAAEQSGQYVMETVGELGLIDAESRRWIIDMLWASRDTREVKREDKLKLAQIAMHEGNIEALFAVLSFLIDDKQKGDDKRRWDKTNFLPLQLQYSVQTLLGQPLDDIDLFDWAFQHRNNLRFNELTRRFELGSGGEVETNEEP